MSAHGGKRNGSGRKAGSATQKTREIANRAAAEGITPLEVMLHAMRKHYEAGALDAAASIAKDAAPYMHPRLNTTTLKGGLDVRQRVVEDVVDADGGNEGEAASDATGVSSE